MLTFTFCGVSGKAYTYSLVVPEIKSLTRQPGKFIFASGNATNPVPELISMSEKLREDIGKHFVPGGFWDIARNVYGASLLYIHVDQERAPMKRQTEKDDLEAAYRPRMNSRG